jgi:subtilase family serine protease
MTYAPCTTPSSSRMRWMRVALASVTALAAAMLCSPLSAAQPLGLYAAGVKDAPDFRDQGHAPSSMPVRLAFTLAYANAYFAPSPQAYAAVLRAIFSAGLTLTQTFGNRTVVDAVGSSAAVERLFQTRIDVGEQTNHGQRYKNVRPALLPPSLRESVVAVTGLDNLISFAPRLTARQGAQPRVIGGPLLGPNGGYGPLAFAQGYDEPIQQGYDGTGRSIANIMAGDINDSDLSAYLTNFQITASYPLIRVTVDGGHLGYYDVETTLDVEAMTGTAPGAQVYLYSFPEFTDQDAEDAYNKVVSDNLVDAANSSWGGCEADHKHALGYAFALASNAIFKQGGAKGITFPIATGDYGWKTCRSHGTINETTADSDPYALAVGGTTLTVDGNGNWVSEKGWRGSAGGVSVVFPVPNYQKRVRTLVGNGRNIPDISLDADPNTGFAEILHSRWFVVGGTSMASPLWVGLEGQIDEYLGTRVGFVNPALYSLARGPQYRTIMHDITTGNNGGYRAVRGFDLVTGLGTPIGMPMAQALQGTP